MGKFLCKKKDYNKELYLILRKMINSDIDKEIVYNYLKIVGFKILDNPIKYSYEETKLRRKLINPIFSEQQRNDEYTYWFALAFPEAKEVIALRSSDEPITFSIIFSKIQSMKTFRTKAVSKKPNDLKFYTNINETPASYKNFFEVNRDEMQLLAEDFDLGNNLISCTETGLRNSYNKDTIGFMNAILRGVPPEFRWTAWLIAAKVPQQRKNDEFLFLLRQDVPLNIDMQIKKDVGRTLAFTEVFFNKPVNQKSLYNVLKAIAVLDPELGYGPGMNQICGFFLIISNFNEIDTFYMMVSILSKTYKSSYGIRGLFLDGFPLLDLLSYQFEVLFKENLPNLYYHFTALINIEQIAWVDNWLQTMFTICFPLHISVRLWDTIVVNGLNFSLNIALGYLHKHETDLLKCMDISDVLNYFVSISKNTYHINVSAQSIIDIAKKIKIDEKYLNELKMAFEKERNVKVSNNVVYRLTRNEEGDTFKHNKYMSSRKEVFDTKRKMSEIQEEDSLVEAYNRI